MDRRIDILDAALELMAKEGANGTSMRAVAAAAGINVATLYHYFPSKTELLKAAIARRRATDLLPHPFPEGLPGTVEDRLATLFEMLFAGMCEDDIFWRAVVAEAMHRDEGVFEALLETNRAFEDTLGLWMIDLFPDAPGLHDAPVVRAIRRAILGVMVEYLPQREGRTEALAKTARDLAAVFAIMSG